MATAGIGSAQELRRELGARNQRYAREHNLPHCFSYGDIPVVCYEPFAAGECHGNFLDSSYAAILSDADWRKRLAKPHSQARRALPNNGRRWMELDSSCSSDALLMNVFCYPRVFTDGRVNVLLGIEDDAVRSSARPQFGVKARVPLAGGKFDRTEVDMRLGNLLVEAKLTETDFQTKAVEVVERYRDLNEVFDVSALPRRATVTLSPIHIDDEDSWPAPEDRETSVSSSAVSTLPAFKTRITGERYDSYQLIRNVLAAHATGAAFCVLCDARRPDLIEAWYAVMRAVRQADLRTRCKVLTWQELSTVLPPRLRNFLDFKYGIAA